MPIHSVTLIPKIDYKNTYQVRMRLRRCLKVLGKTAYTTSLSQVPLCFHSRILIHSILQLGVNWAASRIDATVPQLHPKRISYQSETFVEINNKSIPHHTARDILVRRKDLIAEGHPLKTLHRRNFSPPAYKKMDIPSRSTDNIRHVECCKQPLIVTATKLQVLCHTRNIGLGGGVSEGVT